MCIRDRPRPMVIDCNDARPGPSREGIGIISKPTQFTLEGRPNEDETPQKKERPRGFELVSMYRPAVSIDSNAPVYCLMDLGDLKSFLASLPCKFCLDNNTEITSSNENGFAQQITVHCMSCDQTCSFDTSMRIAEKNAKKPAYDINRRMVKTFCSLGKGHMGLQTFCMGMNMSCISHSSFDKQVNKVIDSTNQYTQESLQKARVEVEKAYLELGDALDQELSLIHI